jgi:hypothetical protein
MQTKLFILALIGVLVITGCTTPASAQPAPNTIPAVIPTEAAPAALPPAPNVTLADNAKTIKLQPGQSFLLKLGEDYDWTVSVSDQNILKRVMNVMVIRGAQGIYVAGKPGTTTLSAIGDPTCLQSQPACSAPSIQFKITINVY